MTKLAEACQAAGALLIAVVTEPVALGLIKSPGEMGADIVVGEGQSLGVGLQFGGPYVGLFACRSEEHTSELQSLMRISYAVFCLKKKTHKSQCTSLNALQNKQTTIY